MPKPGPLLQAVLAATVLAGCNASTAPQGGAAAADVARILQEKAETAREKVAFAELEIRLQEAANLSALARLRTEIKIAQMDLGRFRDMEAPKRIQEAEMDLAAAADAVEDARDELEQLEKMYKGNDLADQTKEIVLKRGRRNLKRSQAQASIKETQARILRDHLLPVEQEKLALEESQKLAQMETETERSANSLRQKRIALAEARSELAQAEAELAKAIK